MYITFTLFITFILMQLADTYNALYLYVGYAKYIIHCHKQPIPPTFLLWIHVTMNNTSFECFPWPTKSQ